VAVVDREDGRRVWAVFNHHTWWPSFVLEIRPGGQSEMIYLQSGWIMSLAEWRVGSATYLVTGGVFNEQQLASVAFVPVSRLPAMSPYEGERYACAGEPVGRPERVLGLPSFEVHTVSAPYPFVYNLQPMAGVLKVSYGDGTAPVIAEINERLELVSLAPADSYWLRHQVLEKEGRVDHSADDCPEHKAIKVLGTWLASAGWTSMNWTMRPR
jgi:hypothetical protein